VLVISRSQVQKSTAGVGLSKGSSSKSRAVRKPLHALSHVMRAYILDFTSPDLQALAIWRAEEGKPNYQK
jgi:hypothetical protein